MKIQKDEAITIAANLIKSLGIPYDSIDAEHVAKGYWQIAFKQNQDDALIGGLASFVHVDDKTGQAKLQEYP